MNSVFFLPMQTGTGRSRREGRAHTLSGSLMVSDVIIKAEAPSSATRRGGHQSTISPKFSEVIENVVSHQTSRQMQRNNYNYLINSVKQQQF